MYLCYDADTGRELAVKQVQFDPESPETSKVRVSWSVGFQNPGKEGGLWLLFFGNKCTHIIFRR